MLRFLILWLSLTACGTPCKNVNMDPLFAGAQRVRVDLYDPDSSRCENGQLAPGAGPALQSRSFTAGEKLELSLAPGKKVVVVTTFSDAAGTMITAVACSEVELGGGKTSCLSISLTEVDAGVITGCSSDAECTPRRCDTVRHQCVECMTPADCSTLHGTPVCAADTCSWSCETGFAHCGTGNTGCDTDITTVDNCGGCGNLCNATNATANRCTAGQCAYDCQTGFLDCLKVGANVDGCESDGHAVTTCGACGVSCDTMHSLGTACTGTACTYTGCMPGYSDCNSMGTNSDGCEFADVTHDVGVASPAPLTYSLACTPLGTPGDPTTYTLMMAQAACTTWTTAVGGPACAAFSCTGNVDCLRANFGGTCATWCYTKTTAGRVAAGGSCSCPNTASPSWN